MTTKVGCVHSYGLANCIALAGRLDVNLLSSSCTSLRASAWRRTAWLKAAGAIDVYRLGTGRDRTVGEVPRRMRYSGDCGGRVVAAWLVTGSVMNMRVRPRRCRC
jgi:hypothetical protein